MVGGSEGKKGRREVFRVVARSRAGMTSTEPNKTGNC